MSYDITFHKSEKKAVPLHVSDLDSLRNLFDIDVFKTGEDGSVMGFSIKLHNVPTNWNEEGFEVYLQPDGYYFTSISYSATDEMFAYFKQLVDTFAQVTGLELKDPQMEGVNENPDKPVTKEQDIFTYAQKVTKAIADPVMLTLIDALRIHGKCFTKLFLLAYNPQLQRDSVLFLNENQLYCNKIEKGQNISDVLKTDVKTLTGSEEYKMIMMKDDGSAKDRFGNDIPRIAFYLRIPYFDPQVKKSSYNLSWK